MVAEIFAQRFTIKPADIDELGHVNNIVYLRWAQEMAIAHWRARADAAQLADYVWVVTRHEADYRAPLELGEEVEARTWVEDAPRGAIWARFVDIGPVGAARPAAQIKSYWCLLDATTRRPKRVRRTHLALLESELWMIGIRRGPHQSVANLAEALVRQKRKHEQFADKAPIYQGDCADCWRSDELHDAAAEIAVDDRDHAGHHGERRAPDNERRADIIDDSHEDRPE
jgi:acyl-CoA thioester hydrolase